VGERSSRGSRVGRAFLTGGRGLRRAVVLGCGLEALDLVDQEQDRAPRGLDVGLRLVLRELSAPATELVDLPCIHVEKYDA
jgi:hypothetical protein